jgi:hypothetical protein
MQNRVLITSARAAGAPGTCPDRRPAPPASGLPARSSAAPRDESSSSWQHLQQAFSSLPRTCCGRRTSVKPLPNASPLPSGLASRQRHPTSSPSAEGDPLLKWAPGCKVSMGKVHCFPRGGARAVAAPGRAAACSDQKSSTPPHTVLRKARGGRASLQWQWPHAGGQHAGLAAHVVYRGCERDKASADSATECRRRGRQHWALKKLVGLLGCNPKLTSSGVGARRGVPRGEARPGTNADSRGARRAGNQPHPTTP